MKVNHLSLKNFKGIKDRKFDFDKINIISGPNGSGKTSIFEALELLLINNLEEKMEHYIHWDGKGFEVKAELDLDITKAKYEIEYQGSTKRVLKTNNDEYFQSDAVKYLQTIINPNLALYSSISRQGESYSILKETPANRLTKFKSIFSIDVLSKIADVIKGYIKTHKEEIKSLEKDIEHLQNKKYEFFPDLEIGDIKETQAKFEYQEKELFIYQDNQEKTKRYETELEAWKTNLIKINTLKEKVENCISEIKRLNSSISTVSVDNVKKQKIKLEEEIEKKAKYDKARDEFLQYKKSKIEIEEVVNNIQYLDIIEPPVDPGFGDGEIEELRNSIFETKSIIKSEEAKYQLAKQGKCPTCNQEYKVTDIETLFNKIASLNGLKDNQLKTFEEHQKILLSYKDEQKKYQNYLYQQESIQKQLDFYQQQLQSLVEVQNPGREVFQVDELKKTLSQFENDLESNHKYELEIQKYTIEQKSFSEQISELSKMDMPRIPILLVCDYNEEEYKKYHKEIAIHEEQIEHQKRIDVHNKEIRKSKESDKQKITDCQVAVDKLYSEIKTLEETRKLLEKDFSSFLIERTTNYIQKKMNHFFQKCYGGYEIYFRQNEKKDSLDFYYSKIGSDELKPAAMTSGYERQLLSMSFRIALGSITHLGLYIFDEIDSDSSTDNSIRLYQNFLEGEKYDQVFIITHNQETIEHLRNNFNVNLIELEK